MKGGLIIDAFVVLLPHVNSAIINKVIGLFGAT
jgi:hypothetical protein